MTRAPYPGPQGSHLAAQGSYLATQGLYIAAQGSLLAAQGSYLAAQGLYSATQGLHIAAQGLYYAAWGLNMVHMQHIHGQAGWQRCPGSKVGWKWKVKPRFVGPNPVSRLQDPGYRI